MIGPFDSFTTSRSPDSGGAAGAGMLACSAGLGREHPTINAADAPRIVRPSSLRLINVGVSLGSGAQVPQPVDLQGPHALCLLSTTTFKASSIVRRPFDKLDHTRT